MLLQDSCCERRTAWECLFKSDEGKVVPVYNTKAYGGVDVYLHAFLIPALYWDEWLASNLGRFTPGTKICLY
jgi:hypothetical protein